MRNKEIIGSYQIGQIIGKGSFAKVKIGKHLLTQQKVAIKIFCKDSMDKEQIKRIIKQISFLKALNKHPNIIQLYETIETTSNIFLIMEYIENGQLFQYIKTNKKLTQNVAGKIFGELLSTIDYMHTNHIVHRDIKPENILLTASLNIKIVDFGLSTNFKQKMKLQSSCGSPCYAIPEMLIGEKYSAKAADIWSAGIVLFTMVCGFLPFEDSDIKCLYKKIMSGKLQFIGENSLEVRDLLQNILNKHKQKRYKLEDIKSHKWIIKNSKNFFTKNFELDQEEEIDPFIIKELEIYGIEESYSRNSLQENKYNFATTIYKILKKKIKFSGSTILLSNPANPLPKMNKIAQQYESFQSEPSNIDRKEINRNLSQIKTKRIFINGISMITPSRYINQQDKNSNSKLRNKSSKIKLMRKSQDLSTSKCQKRKKKLDKNEQYFKEKKFNEQKYSPKKLSMYEKIQSVTNLPTQYQVLYLKQKQSKLTKCKNKI